ncbi:DUF1045 domain-containing protein [Variovorax sp. YR752]|uniref:DUF1045 domain-containing protein n=1 Tax=Variovorax sp. YR752 TaxID=1884383 RepID=UPI003137B03D
MSAPGLPRDAIYFAPDPRHPLWHAGCAWLGRDARSAAPSPPARPGVQHPWRYGWHATLKAPMRLAPGTSEADWLDDVARLAASHPAFTMPALQVGWLTDFLALQPRDALPPDHPLRRLADDCVLRLDRWRAAPDEAERERQRRSARTARQAGQVERLGYAHVLDDWRFHMTLSDSLAGLDETTAGQLHRQAVDHFAEALAEPLQCDALCVFVEPSPGAPFELRHRLALGAR